jgi:hypothetical protein
MLEKIKGYIPLNFGILSNPVNWAIVILMIALAGVGLAAILNPTDIFNDQPEVV